MNLSIAVVKDQSIKVGTAAAGFVGAHALVKFSKKDNLVTSLIFLVGGMLLAVNVKNEHVQNAALGASLYGGLRTINHIAPPTGGEVKGLEGLGIALPAKISEAINKFVPQLGDLSDIELGAANPDDPFNLLAGDDIIDLGEGDYEILNGLDAADDLDLGGGDDEDGISVNGVGEISVG